MSEPTGPRTVRSIMREHLRFHGLDIHNDLSRILGVTPLYAGTLMRNRHNAAIVPERVELFIEAMKLDSFDATELRLYGAREDGWKLTPRDLIRLKQLYGVDKD
ncbi:MAG TPA: hypothetical protein VF680_17335 [Allosphingosinicella sp.]|jgi:hypothetical protein